MFLEHQIIILELFLKDYVQWCSLGDTQVYGVCPLAKVKDTHLKKCEDM